MGPVLGLGHDGWGPGQLGEDYGGSGGKGKALGASGYAQNCNSDVLRVLKFLDSLMALLWIH